jgi:hypothetical protein
MAGLILRFSQFNAGEPEGLAYLFLGSVCGNFLAASSNPNYLGLPS